MEEIAKESNRFKEDLKSKEEILKKLEEKTEGLEREVILNKAKLAKVMNVAFMFEGGGYELVELLEDAIIEM